MLGTLTVFSLAFALRAGPNTLVGAQSIDVAGDSGRGAWQDSTSRAPTRASARVGFGSDASTPARKQTPDSTAAQRRRAVEHSDWYYRRLTLHKLASYTTIPLFVTEYVLGDKLIKNNGTTSTNSTRAAHGAVAAGLGVLFGVNTLTGVWNLWDSRHESQGRARRITHSVLMLTSDAGFLATAALAPEGRERGEFGEVGSNSDRNTHRAVAIGSMGVSLASYLMMYLWK